MKNNFATGAELHFVGNFVLVGALQLMRTIQTRYFTIQTPLSTGSGVTINHVTCYTVPTDEISMC